MLGLTMTAPLLHAQDRGGYEERYAGPVERTIEDVQAVAEHNRAYSGRERERYDNALRHLSQFQESMRGRDFDKDKLDEAIEDVQNVVDHNPLDGRARNVLRRDLGALRSLRSRYDHGYRRY